MNIKANLPEKDVNFVDITMEQNTYIEINLFLFAIIISLFSF